MIISLCPAFGGAKARTPPLPMGGVGGGAYCLDKKKRPLNAGGYIRAEGYFQERRLKNIRTVGTDTDHCDLRKKSTKCLSIVVLVIPQTDHIGPLRPQRRIKILRIAEDRSHRRESLLHRRTTPLLAVERCMTLQTEDARVPRDDDRERTPMSHALRDKMPMPRMEDIESTEAHSMIVGRSIHSEQK